MAITAVREFEWFGARDCGLTTMRWGVRLLILPVLWHSCRKPISKIGVLPAFIGGYIAFRDLRPIYL